MRLKTMHVMNTSSSKDQERRAAGLAAGVSKDVADAVATLRDWRADPAARVFSARKKIKRLRSIARLLGPHSDKSARRLERLFRDAGRRLSAARDADAIAAAADALADRVHDPEARRALSVFAEARRTAGAPLAADIRDAIELLNEAGALAACSPAPTRATVTAALGRMDARAAALFAAARGSERSEPLHEWRKRLKERWHAARVLGADDPRVDAERARLMRRVARALGIDRDLMLLAEAVDADPAACGGPEAAQAARAAIDTRRKPLQRKALRLGAEVHG